MDVQFLFATMCMADATTNELTQKGCTLALQSEMFFAMSNESALKSTIFQVHSAAQLHRDRGPHGGESPARARLGKILLGTEKGHKKADALSFFHSISSEKQDCFQIAASEVQ